MVDIVTVLCHGGTSLQCFQGSNKIGTCKVIDPISSLHYLAPHYILGCASTKPLLYIWNTGQDSSVMKYVLPGIASYVTTSPYGHYIITATDNIMRIWHLPSGSLVTTVTVHYQKISCLTFSKDNKFVISGGDDNVVYVWLFAKMISSNNKVPLYSFSHHSMPVRSVYCGYGGSKARLFTSSLDNACNIYDLCSGNLLLNLCFPSPLVKVVVDPTETSLYALSVTNEIFKVSLVDKTQDDLQNSLKPFIKSSSKITTFSLSDKLLIVGSSNGSVIQYDSESGQTLPDFVCKNQDNVLDILNIRYSNYVRNVKHQMFPYQKTLQKREGVEIEESVVMLKKKKKRVERTGDEMFLDLVKECAEEENAGTQKENLKKMENLSTKLLEIVTSKILDV